MASIRVPARKPDTWHERSEWQQYANKLFRYYSRSSGFVLRFVHDPAIIAAVEMKHRRVLLNPAFPVPSEDLRYFVRARPWSTRETVVQFLRGLLAHEAAHVRYSSDKPAGLLGSVWNTIEDERIERLMARGHPDLVAAFTHIGDVVVTRRFEELTGDPLEGVLVWRWTHDHPGLTWPCNDERAWHRVRPHVEAAWCEPDPDRVVDHARAILRELGLNDDDETPEYLQGPEVSFPFGFDGDPGAGSSAGHGAKASRTSRADGSGDERDDERVGDTADEGTTPGSGEEPDEAVGQTWPLEGTVSEASTTDPQEPSIAEHAPDSRDGGGDDVDDGGTRHGSRATPADPNEARGARTASPRNDPGTEPGLPPPEPPLVMPDEPDHQRARELLQEVEPKARALGAALALPEAPRTRISHQSRGRFDYGRYAQGAQRPFRVAHQPNRREMPNVTVLHDVSYSMGDVDNPASSQFAAVRASMMLHRACEYARTPFRLIAFDNEVDVIVEPHDDSEQARGAIAGLRSREGTRLAPALSTALSASWTTTPGRPRTHVVLVYCDGDISSDDAEACRALTQDSPRTFILPVLIGADVDGDQFDAAFGRSLHAPDITTLADRVRRWVASNLH